MLCSSCSQAHPRSHQPIKAFTKRARGTKAGGNLKQGLGRRDTLPASLPGLALHSITLRQEIHPGESTLPLGLRCLAVWGHGTAYGMQGKGIWTLHKISVVSPHNIDRMIIFWFLLIDALDKMHEEYNNEKILRKKSPYYSSFLHIVNVPLHWCLAPFWCLLS